MNNPKLNPPIDDVYSDTSVFDSETGDMRRLTWRELADERRKEVNRLSRFATMVGDLDRNEHGRHEGDVDGNDVSDGNPHIRPGETFAYSLHGAVEYRMPERGQRHDPDAWAVRANG